MHTNDVLFLLSIPKQDQEISPCSCSRLSLLGGGHVLVRCSHTVTGLRTLFLFLLFLDLLWNFLVPSTPQVQPGLVYKHLCHSIIQSLTICEIIFRTPVLPNLKSQAAKFFKEGSSFHNCHMACTMCCMSHVMCHMSHVTYHMSHVMCNICLIFYSRTKW